MIKIELKKKEEILPRALVCKKRCYKMLLIHYLHSNNRLNNETKNVICNLIHAQIISKVSKVQI